jgi:hypothetical protein
MRNFQYELFAVDQLNGPKHPLILHHVIFYKWEIINDKVYTRKVAHIFQINKLIHAECNNLDADKISVQETENQVFRDSKSELNVERRD